jgi:hypothetical protein
MLLDLAANCSTSTNMARFPNSIYGKGMSEEILTPIPGMATTDTTQSIAIGSRVI